MSNYRERLIAARHRLNLTQVAMARRLLTSPKTYQQWESGARRTPGVAVVAAEHVRVRPPLDRPHRKPGPKSKWPAILASAAEQGMTSGDLARQIGCAQKTVTNKAAQFSVQLRRKDE